MRKKLLVLLFVVLASPLAAQISFTGSMGINYFSASSLKDYLNMNYPSNNGLLSTFNASVGFYGELDIPVSSNYEVGVEYMYQIYSYNAPSLSGGVYDFSLDQQKISALGYYVIHGNGYMFKFGGGAGIRFASANEQIYTTTNYTSTGFGFLGRALGLTSLGKNFYAVIGVDAAYDFTGEPSNGNQKISNPSLNKNVNLNSFTLGLRIGMTYIF